MNISKEIAVLIQPRKTFAEALAVGMPLVRRTSPFLSKPSWIKPGGSTGERLGYGGGKEKVSEEEKFWQLTSGFNITPQYGDFSSYLRTMALAVSTRQGITSKEVYTELARNDYFPASFTEAMHYFQKISGQKISLGKVFHLGTVLHDEKLFVWIVETISFEKIKVKLLTPAKQFAAGSQFVVIKEEKKKK